MVDVLLVLASQPIALFIHAGHGSEASLAFAGFVVWVVVYAAVFGPVLQAGAHVTISVATKSFPISDELGLELGSMQETWNEVYDHDEALKARGWTVLSHLVS